MIWILLISFMTAVVGFWAWTLEVIHGDVDNNTTWSELNTAQWEYSIMMIGGSLVFIISLIITAIQKA